MDFHYEPMFQLGKDETEYYLLTKDHVSVGDFEGHPILKVEKEGLTKMANAAFRDVSFLLRRSHNEQVNYLCVKTQVLLSFMEKKVNKCGLDIATKRLCLWVFTKHIPKKTFAIVKMLL